MASSFKLRYNVSVTPVEEVTLADGSDVSYNINSNVDKILGGSSSRTIGSTAALVKYKSSYTTTTSGVALSDATILNNATIFTLLFIKIISAGSTGTPTVDISTDSGATYQHQLLGVGDCLLLPGGSVDQFGAAVVYVVSPSADTVANIEIIAGGI